MGFWPWGKNRGKNIPDVPAEDPAKIQEKLGNELYTFLAEHWTGTKVRISSMPKNGKEYSIIGGVPEDGTM